MKLPLLVLALVAAPASAQTPPAPAPPTKVIADAGLLGSECARYDDRTDDYIVSNLGPAGAGNDGFLSRLGPDGSVRQLKWVEGGRDGATLVQPLGVFVAGDLVHVADLATVRLFDRRTGAPRGSIDVPGATRLNDLTVAADGTIYVTDSGSDDVAGAIYAIRNGKVRVFAARDEALERPNGIAVLRDGTVVHGGRGVNLVYRSPAGRIVRERTLPTGRIDGIVPLADGTLLVASQDGHVVYRVPATGTASVAAADIPVPAAIGWDAGRNRLIVPQIRAATVSFYTLAP